MVKGEFSTWHCPTAWVCRTTSLCQPLVQPPFLWNHPDSWGERLLVIRSLLHVKRHVIMSFQVERTKLLQLSSARVCLLMPPNWWQPGWENLHLNWHEKRLETYPHAGLQDMLDMSLPSMFSRIPEFQVPVTSPVEGQTHLLKYFPTLLVACGRICPLPVIATHVPTDLSSEPS